MIEPVFNQRLREMERAGKDWTAKEVGTFCSMALSDADGAQDDLLSCLIANVPAERRNARALSRILLIVNLIAVHSTTQVRSCACIAAGGA